MEIEEGSATRSFKDLSSLGVKHFKTLFKAPMEAYIAEVIRVAHFFPRYIDEEGNDSIMELVSKEEVEGILKAMQKDKSPGPDGWTVEFFQHFFETLGDDLLAVFKESRRTGTTYKPFDSTFLTLIPKKEDFKSFDDFRPISLFSCIYKIISKLMATRLKPFLSRNISLEQYGFLDGNKIHEVIGVAQDTIHCLKRS